LKSLLLIRHAKSDWNDPSLDDFDRPLNERGKKDAPLMAQRLVDKKIKVDAFLSSPAKRAAKTARAFAEALGKKKDSIIFEEKLYLASVDTFFKVISLVDDRYDSVALFSHNNGLTDFANQLTDTRTDNIPTCGIFAIKIQANSWEEIREAKKEFWFFDYPKSL
jgi:phosphohistidine phosphatase